jgi:hypothetical protein
MSTAMHRRRLTESEISMLTPYIPREDLDSACLHLDYVPWYLPRRFCAVVRGSDIYFRAGVQEQNAPRWLALLGHELVHVGQYRNGMTAFRYLCAAVRGYRQNRYEKEAFAVQSRIVRDLGLRTCLAAASREPGHRGGER